MTTVLPSTVTRPNRLPWKMHHTLDTEPSNLGIITERSERLREVQHVGRRAAHR